jgi:hypothetical protein
MLARPTILHLQGSLQMMLGMSGWFHAIPHCGALMFGGLGATLATAVAWWRDAIIEGDMGMHTEVGVFHAQVACMGAGVHAWGLGLALLKSF